MTFEQVQNQVLKLLNQYSVAGALVAPAYNNQQDYLNRVPCQRRGDGDRHDGAENLGYAGPLHA